MADRRIASAVGLYGKLPARGDFVRLALPGDFIAAWDEWLARVIAASRALLGAAWLPAFLEAPVWRFALAPGVAGRAAVSGVWLPSVDRVGRYFPLTLIARLPLAAPAWFDACEAAARAALDEDATPEMILARLPLPEAAGGAPMSGSLWWTEGGPRVPAWRLALPGLPDGMQFARMLGGVLAAESGT